MTVIQLTKGKTALIDSEDFERVLAHKWHFDGKYPARSIRQGKRTRHQRLHRFLMSEPDGEVDHIDLNTLNNQKDNLRIATSSQQKCNIGMRSDNTSGVKGVFWKKENRKWIAQIRVHGHNQYLGSFTELLDAESVYNAAAARLHGEFARPARVIDNPPNGNDGPGDQRPHRVKAGRIPKADRHA